MLAAQTREWRGGRPEYPASMIAVRFNQSLAELLSRGVGPRRILVAHQQQGQRNEWRIAMIASMANLFVIESLVVLGAGMPQGVVTRMIGLNQDASGKITATGAAGDLGD